MTQALTPHFEETVANLIDDWRGQDEMFFHDRAMRTIVWYVGRVKSLQNALAEIKKSDRRKFIQAVCNEYGERGMTERRAYEAIAIYKAFSKPSDSLKETCERIFQTAGSWSKALPSGKKEMAEVEPPKCNHICPIHP